MLATKNIIEIMNSGKSNIVGLLGENLVYNTLSRLGLSVRYVANIGNMGDIIVNRQNIEIKTAKRNKHGTFKFCLVKDDKHGYTNVYDSEYLILQCIDNGLLAYYIIPTKDITVKYLTISNLNSGKYTKYRTSISKIANILQ